MKVVLSLVVICIAAVNAGIVKRQADEGEFERPPLVCWNGKNGEYKEQLCHQKDPVCSTVIRRNKEGIQMSVTKRCKQAQACRNQSDDGNKNNCNLGSEQTCHFCCVDNYCNQD